MTLKGERIEILKELEDKINYKFNNFELLNLAFVHTSYANEHSSLKGKHNERLEFLGDAVLEMVFSEILFKNFKPKQEGYLTKLRSNLVCEASFSELSDEINLSKYLLLGKGEEKTGGRHKDSIKADLFEAFNGALYLDAGYEVVYNFIYGLIKDKIFDENIIVENVNDYKSMLQEHLHKYKNINLKYELVKEEGPSHDKTFYIKAYLDSKFIGAGKGRNKKLAEQNAAKNALKKLHVI